ncbi:argonaute-like protein [Mycena floridula]|nr:argonaute-like protein [Mycena floridula]
MQQSSNRGSRGGGGFQRGGNINRGAGARGNPRGSFRGGGSTGSTGGRGGALSASTSLTSHLPASHVTAVGVKRPGFGRAGRRIKVFVNAFVSGVPEGIISHYDVLTPERSARVNLQIIKVLQEQYPDIFTPKAVYDGRKNIFSSRVLPLGPTNSQTFEIMLPLEHNNPRPAGARPPPVTRVRLTKVADINPEVLSRFLDGQQSQSNEVLTAITALNVVIRMAPTMAHPFNSRSFYTDAEIRRVGFGVELWRGYFQSARPSIGRLLINVDISTAMMYKPGPLKDVCLEYLNRGQNVRSLIPLAPRDRNSLQRFLHGVRVDVQTAAGQRSTCSISGLSAEGADRLTFTDANNRVSTVAAYYHTASNLALAHPQLFCIKTKSGAFIPVERCTVRPGQIAKKEIPPGIQQEFLAFASKSPADRLQSIQRGVQVLGYGQSEYVRDFGMSIDTTSLPLAIEARVIDPPTLKYGPGKQAADNRNPRFGAWNMVDKKFSAPCSIDQWMVIIYEVQSKFNMGYAESMVNDIVANCAAVGIQIEEKKPMIEYQNPQGNIAKNLDSAGLKVLPDNGNDVYRSVKYFGDVVKGVATACVLASKARKAKPQYWANVLLKVNVKLGGANWTLQDSQGGFLSDPQNPTIIMGADVIHPAPGSTAPSFAGVVGSINSTCTKFFTSDQVQKSRQEIISGLKEMALDTLKSYMFFRGQAEKKAVDACKPKRLIFYRDGVSEGQFKQVLDEELRMLKEACTELKIDAKITFIVVGKRHHIRFFPDETTNDRSGNCPAGTGKSHAGILGTSRSAHYSCFAGLSQHGTNAVSADSVQAMSYALCHIYARSTHADIVCTRAKARFDPDHTMQSTDAGSATGTADTISLEEYKKAFKPLHPSMKTRSFFMLSS